MAWGPPLPPKPRLRGAIAPHTPRSDLAQEDAMGAKKKAKMRKKHKEKRAPYSPEYPYGPDGNYDHLRALTPYLETPMPDIRADRWLYDLDYEFTLDRDGYEPIVRGQNHVHEERVLEVGWFLLSTGGWVTFGTVTKQCVESAVQEFEKYDDYIAAYAEGSFWDGYTITGYFYTHDDAQRAGRAIANMWDIDLKRMPSEPPLPPRPPRPQIIRC